MIRKARENDLKKVEAGYTNLLTYEKEHINNSNWVLGLYPTIKTAEKAFSEDTLYVFEEDGIVLGSMILNQIQPEDYKYIKWEYEADEKEVLVVHTLCIIPSSARKGCGRKMMDFALNKGKEIGCIAVRLETYAGNEPAKALYKSMGFRFAGEGSVMLAGVIPEEQVFFEKKL